MYQTSAGVQDPLRKPGYTDVGIRLGVGWQRPGLCQTFSGSTICGEGQNNADVGITFGVEWQRPGEVKNVHRSPGFVGEAGQVLVSG